MRRILLLGLILTTAAGFSQSVDFPIGHYAYPFIEGEDVQAEEGFSTTVRPLARKDASQLIKAGESNYLSKELWEYTGDSSVSGKPFLRKFYQKKTDFYYYKDENVGLHINPAMQFSFGRTNDPGLESLFINSRGIELRGSVDNKVAFYTYLSENQARYPAFVNNVRDSTLVVPYEGFWKQYNTTGVDFFRAQGYIDFGLSQSISAQLGFGKHFVGNGMRSLLLSDYANNYPYLRINTQSKIFDYTNVFAELIADVQGGAFGILGTGGFSKKYMAMHHLNIKIKPNFHVGLFEAVMYGDSSAGIKVEYLNPVIFYRAIEQQNGSADNAFVGLDFKWNIKKRVSLYGQLMVDELIVSEVFSSSGWWGNKQGIQFGAKYFNAFGKEGLMVQGEYNRVRPYTYAHENGFTSYSHYNLSLAHPLGANFTEYLGRATYQLNDQWNFEAVILQAKYGNDIGGINYGRDILKDYTVRLPDGNGGSQDFGNEHIQGNETDLSLFFFRTSYMWKHNLFIDMDLTLRNEKDTNGLIDTSSTIFALSFRWNVPGRNYLF